MPMYKKSLFILLCIAVITATVAFFTYHDNNEDTVNLPISSESATSDTSTADVKNSTDNADEDIMVYVNGEVNSPGLVSLKQGSRIADAIQACGDFTPNADKGSVNLAQKAVDGMQINVLSATMQTTANENNNNANISSNNKVNINTATKEELDTLPGIGPAMAERIIEYRQTNGSFKNIDEIKNVRGIGEAKFAKMQDKITI